MSDPHDHPHTAPDFGESLIDHLNIGVSDLARSRAFYEAALAPLGVSVLHSIPAEGAESGGDQARLGQAMCGFGRAHKPLFWILGGARPGEGLHVAFAAPDRASVDAFHAAALAAGGRDNGAPGLRYYHPNYYGAFVLDPDGNNVEAVCHRPG